MKYVRVILKTEAAGSYNSLLSKAPESKQEVLKKTKYLNTLDRKIEGVFVGTKSQVLNTDNIR